MKCLAGTSANAVHFQAYLLEGLARWNKDRASAATSDKGSGTYSSLLCCAVNKLSESVLNKKLHPSFTEPRKYTGKQ